ncbi:ATP-binding protein [Streptomyces sp. SID4928]|uniref:hypothetical protein n=1 Tax=unclassified Streptomyces TaxID=2593676 RepID=UPI000683375F|nr:hypothetical protein [Streptomyces sp. ACT-1]MYR49320.1 ATP-binding protein [Streptomyces sp. SID4928]
MTATLTRDPQQPARISSRLGDILTQRGIAPGTTAQEPVPEPVTALELAAARIPARYRHALADHPQVTDWVDEIARAGRPGPAGARGITEGPSLRIVGPTGTGKTHQAYGAIRALLAAGVRLRWEAVTAPPTWLINHRYEHLRPTLITSNLTTDALRAALGDRVASRLAEMTERVTLDGDDRRRARPAA